jgi:hypothetical protein
MIPATHENLVGAYKAHKKVAQNGDLLSHKLIKVYAAECAIKGQFLKENGLKDTSKIDNQMYSKNRGHNLSFWLKKLKISKLEIHTPDTENGNYNIGALHEYLRYNIEIPETVKTSQMQFIQDVVKIIGKNL